MHRHLIILAILGTYYSLVTFALYSFDAGLLATSLMLFGVPAILLAHFTQAPSAVVLSVAAMGVGVAVLLESIAHTYGLWYSLGENEVRLAGVLPLEMVSALTLQIIFLALCYEALFDDGNYTLRSARARLLQFIVFAVAALGLVFMHQYILNGLFLSYSYIWIIGILTAASFAMLAVYRALSVQFFDRIIEFALIGAVPSALALWLALENTHKVFAHSQAYITEVLFFGHPVPVEEVVLLFTLPLFVATVYELYLDDRS